jgi:hypothetical protein
VVERKAEILYCGERMIAIYYIFSTSLCRLELNVKIHVLFRQEMRERDFIKNPRNRIFTNLFCMSLVHQTAARKVGLASASAAARFFSVIPLAYSESAEGSHYLILCEEDLTLERNILFIEVDLEHLIFV